MILQILSQIQAAKQQKSGFLYQNVKSSEFCGIKYYIDFLYALYLSSLYSIAHNVQFANKTLIHNWDFPLVGTKTKFNLKS